MSEPDKTIAEFCSAKRISKTFYYELARRGLAPDETIYPGSRVKRISATAERAWDQHMAELAQGEAARLEAARRRELATIAGRIAAQSLVHVSSSSRRNRRRSVVIRGDDECAAEKRRRPRRIAHATLEVSISLAA